MTVVVTKTKLRAWLSGRGAWLIWLGGVAVLVAFGAWVAGALGLGSEPVTTRLTSAGVVVAVLTGVIKVCMWLPAKLRGPDTVTDAAEQLREAVYRRAEETRETLLGGFRYADLTLAGPPGKADQRCTRRSTPDACSSSANRGRARACWRSNSSCGWPR